jgi:hypothetical protein
LSRLLAHFIYKYFHYHDYNHAFHWNVFPWSLMSNICYVCVYIHSEVVLETKLVIFGI